MAEFCTAQIVPLEAAGIVTGYRYSWAKADEYQNLVELTPAAGNIVKKPYVPAEWWKLMNSVDYNGELVVLFRGF